MESPNMDERPPHVAESRRTALARRFRAVPRLVEGAPRWLAAVLGLVLVAAGLHLLARPLTALGILGWYIGVSCLLSGIGDLIADTGGGHTEGGDDVLRLAVAWMWILGGLTILAVAGRDPGLLGSLVVVMLFVSGALALIGLLGDHSADSVLAGLLGVSEIAFAAVALLWPDATLVVIGVLFAGRTIVFGLLLLWRSLSGWHPRSGRGPEAPRSSWQAAARWSSVAIAFLLALTVVSMGHSYRDGVPVVDDFYDYPTEIPEDPGRLLRLEPYEGDLPAGMTGYRLLYVTTNEEGDAILSSAALAAPADSPTPSPLITWAHGTVGVARGCAPTLGPDAIASNGIPAVDALVRNNWAIVATDYPGLGTDGPFPYLIRHGQGRAVLDAVRAAHQITDIHLTDQAVVWGHSQGGHAALAAGELAPTYAPELSIVGTAALSPAANPMALADTVLSHPEAAGASLGVSFVVDAYTRYYDDIEFDKVVAPTARTIVREAAARCTTQTGTLATILTGLAIARDQPIVHPDALNGPFGDRLHQNIPTGPWGAPVFIAHGDADEVIPSSLTEQYVASLGRQEADVEYHLYPGGTHMSILQPGAPLNRHLEQWTRERYTGG